MSNDSDRPIGADDTGQLRSLARDHVTARLLDATTQISRDMQKMDVRLAKIEAHIESDALAKLETRVETLTTQVNGVTVEMAGLQARFTIVVVMLGAVALVALGALLKALKLG